MRGPVGAELKAGLEPDAREIVRIHNPAYREDTKIT